MGQAGRGRFFLRQKGPIIFFFVLGNERECGIYPLKISGLFDLQRLTIKTGWRPFSVYDIRTLSKWVDLSKSEPCWSLVAQGKGLGLLLQHFYQ